jgi:hypothetical protein
MKHVEQAGEELLTHKPGMCTYLGRGGARMRRFMLWLGDALLQLQSRREDGKNAALEKRCPYRG